MDVTDGGHVRVSQEDAVYGCHNGLSCIAVTSGFHV